MNIMHNHIESVHYTPDHTLRYILFDQKYIEIKQLRNTPLTTEQVDVLFSPDIPDIKDRLVCKYASPYCGITGFNSMKELQEIGSEFDRLKIFGMFGLLVSWRQCAWAGLNASEEEKKKTKDWVDPRYVPIDQLHDFCAYAHSHGLAMIHYNTINEKFASELMQLIDTYHLESVLDGFQLNFRFLPDPAELHALVTRYPSLTFIYQLRPITMIESEGKIPLVWKNASDHQPRISYYLLDGSGGKGKFDINELINSLNKYLKYNMEYHYIGTLGIAGGLCSDNVFDVCQSIEAILGHKNFSIDAEGKLRTEDRQHLNLAECKKYITNYARFYKT